MVREWLPQLLTALFLLVFAITGATYLAKTEEGKNEMWGHWAKAIGGAPETHHNETVTEEGSTSTSETVIVSLPPMKFVVWATVICWGAAGFYLAAGIAAFIHRDERRE